MTARSSRASHRDEILIACLAAFIYSIPLHLSRPLLFGVTDLRNFALNVVRSRDSGIFIFGASGDFSRSLGISNYPVSLILDLPWLLATSVPAHLAQLVFGVATCMSLYLAVNLLGQIGKVAVHARQAAGFALPILMFLPGPIEWNRYARYTASFGWTVATLTVALSIFLLRSRKPGWGSLAPAFLLGCLIFWTNISYLPMTLPVTLIAIGFGWTELRPTIMLRRYFSHAATILLPAVLASPLFLGVYLFGVWAIPDAAVQENVDRISSWSDLGYLLLPFPTISSTPPSLFPFGGIWLRVLMSIALIISIWVGGKRRTARLSRLGAWSLISLSFYTLVYYLAARFANREIGLDPKYVEIVAYPVWILLIANLLFSTRILFSRSLQRGWAVLPVIAMLVWGTQWTVRNTDTRFQSPVYPVRLSDTSLRLQELTAKDQENGNFSRVIIVQERFPAEREAEGHRIRRSTNFSDTFYLELSQLKVPILNAYSHLISPRTFKTTNELFGDGRPSWRQYSLYDQVSVTALPTFGIKYVLSEVPINDPFLELLSAEPYLAFGESLAPAPAYLYRVSLRDVTGNLSAKYSLTGTGLRVRGGVSQPTTLIIPVEYSRCLYVDNASPISEETIEKNSNYLVKLVVNGSFDFELRYMNSLFQIRNCRILDYLDFRKG